MISTNHALRRVAVPEMRYEIAQRPFDTSRRKILIGGAAAVAVALGVLAAVRGATLRAHR